MRRQRAARGAGASLAMVTALCALILMFPRTARAAQADDGWLPVSAIDLALKDNPESPGADAMILYRESDVNERTSSDDEYVRIKIFTKDGVKRGDIEISFLKGVDTIKDVRARTIRPDGSIVDFQGEGYEKQVMKASGVKLLAKTFTMPDVQPGCIIEYRYRDQWQPGVPLNSSWVLQQDMFTRLARFRITPAPNAFAELRFRSFRLPDGVTPKKEANGDLTLEVSDVPGIEEEPFMPPESTLQERVEFYYRNGSMPKGETNEQYWSRIGKDWSAGDEEYINHKREVEQYLSTLVGAGDSPETKLRKIYQSLQQFQNLTVEESKMATEQKHEAIKPNKTVVDVIKHRYGYSLQINLLLVALARAAGFEANLLYVAPRNKTYFYPEAQDTDELADDVVWVRAGGREYYLDAGSKYYPFGILPWFETETGGLRLSKAGGEIIHTPGLAASDAMVLRHADLKIADDGSASGTLEVDFTAEAAATRRWENNDEDETGRRKALSDEIRESLPADSSVEVTSIENWDDLAQPLVVKGTLKITGFASSAGRHLIFPDGVFRSPVAEAFRAETRMHDILFPYPYEQIDDVKLQLPPGYQIEAVPAKATLQSGSVSYELSAAQMGQMVEIKRGLTIGQSFFARNTYPQLRGLFSGIHSADGAQIVLDDAKTAQKN